jgi:hypothetical protein
VEHLVADCWGTLRDVASTWRSLPGSKLFRETRVICLRSDWVRQCFAPNVVRFGMACLRTASVRIGLAPVPRAMVIRHRNSSFPFGLTRSRCELDSKVWPRTTFSHVQASPRNLRAIGRAAAWP